MEHFNPPHPEPSVALVAHHPGVKSTHVAYEFAPAGYGSDAGNDSDSGSILEYWRMLRRHKKTVLSFALIGALLGIAICIPQKPVYQARTSLEVLNLNEDFLNMKQSNPVTSNDNSYETSEEQTQVKLLESDSLLNHVLAKLDPNFVASPKLALKDSGWRSVLHLPEPQHLSPLERLLNKAADSLKIRATPKTRIIEVTVNSTEPQLAMNFANTLAQEFIERNLEARWETTHRTSDWLGRELGDARRKLEQSEDALQAYARTSGLIFTDENTNVSTEKLQQIQQELSTATADRIAKQSRYQLARSSSPDALPDVLSDPGLREAQSKMTDLNRQIAELSATFTPEYSKVKRAQAQMATLEASFERDRAAILERIANDFHEASEKEKLLASAYDSQTREVSGQGEKSIQYNILKREVDSSRQLYDNMLQQLKQSSIASAMRASNVRIVDSAELPDIPVSPKLPVNAGVGLLLGLLSSIGLVIVRESADRTLQQPGDAQFWTNLPELGTIPSATVDGQKKFYGRRKQAANSLESAPLSVGMPSQGAASDASVEMMTWNRKPSFVAEAFRSTLTSILFVGENGSRPRVLVMTSANAADGKTTVVSNLGIAMAEIRRSVVIIDADLRRPRLHDVFHLPNERGLSDLLRMEQISDDSLHGLVQPTTVPGLHVLPSGPATHAAANLLYSPNLRSLIERLKTKYDMVLIDTPPMLQMTDARVAGRLADAVVVIARAGQTTRDAVTAATQRLKEDRIPVLGTILNDWNPKQSPGGYYGHYKQSYYTAAAASARN